MLSVDRRESLAGIPDTIVREARAESLLWEAALRHDPDWEPVFSMLAPDRYALGLETIYEAYLVHYGSPRLFSAAEESERVLLGDYLYAHGLLRIAEAGGVEAVATMAELISRCAALRASGEGGEGEAWVEATRSLGGSPSREEIEVVLLQHDLRSTLQGPDARRGRISR